MVHSLSSVSMTPAIFTGIFIGALGLSLGIHLWLAGRQIRYVLAHRGAIPPHFADRITLSAHQKAADYTVAHTRLSAIDLVVDAAVLLALTLGGGLSVIAGWLAATQWPPLAQDVALIVAVGLIAGVLSLPLAWYRTFVIEERFGFNRTTLKLWIADLAKGALVAAALGVPLVALILWLMARAGALWWFYAWLAWVGFQVLILALYPTVIAPLFNKFAPLADASVKERVERLLERCGFRAKGFYVMDGSRRSRSRSRSSSGSRGDKSDTCSPIVSRCRLTSPIASRSPPIRRPPTTRSRARAFRRSTSRSIPSCCWC